jgi:DNA-binding NarL/FixJ family response regulator
MTRTSARAANAIEIVERAYDVSGTEADWLRGVVDGAFTDLDFGDGLYAFTDESALPQLVSTPAFVQRDVDQSIAERLAVLNRGAPAEYYTIMRRCQVACGGLESTFGADHGIVRQFRAHMEPVGILDGFSLFAHDGQSGGITLSSPARAVVEMPPRVRGIWRRVGIHLANALRLRRRLASKMAEREAIFDPQGKLEDVAPRIKDNRTACRTLVAGVHSMERARTAKVRRTPEEALSLWQGLVGGHWSLVEHWEKDGRRYLAAIRNRPGIVDPRALTRSEASVLHYVGLGAPNKEIAFTLGLSSGAVSRALSQLLRKFRCKGRVDLAHFADPARLARIDLENLDPDVSVLSTNVGPMAPATTKLSAAEREIAGFVLRGFSNDRIARERSTSAHTIANQLRTLYVKLGVSSRSELAAVLSRND